MIGEAIEQRLFRNDLPVEPISKPLTALVTSNYKTHFSGIGEKVRPFLDIRHLSL
jgi:hypothetical protein